MEVRLVHTQRYRLRMMIILYTTMIRKELQLSLLFLKPHIKRRLLILALLGHNQTTQRALAV